MTSGWVDLWREAVATQPSDPKASFLQAQTRILDNDYGKWVNQVNADAFEVPSIPLPTDILLLVLQYCPVVALYWPATIQSQVVRLLSNAPEPVPARQARLALQCLAHGVLKPLDDLPLLAAWSSSLDERCTETKLLHLMNFTVLQHLVPFDGDKGVQYSCIDWAALAWLVDDNRNTTDVFLERMSGLITLDHECHLNLQITGRDLDEVKNQLARWGGDRELRDLKDVMSNGIEGSDDPLDVLLRKLTRCIGLQKQLPLRWERLRCDILALLHEWVFSGGLALVPHTLALNDAGWTMQESTTGHNVWDCMTCYSTRHTVRSVCRQFIGTDEMSSIDQGAVLLLLAQFCTQNLLN